MKLPDGVTVHVGGRKYRGEMPDELVPKGLKKNEPAKSDRKRSGDDA